MGIAIQSMWFGIMLSWKVRVTLVKRLLLSGGKEMSGAKDKLVELRRRMLSYKPIIAATC